jgi:hypothetical protein
VGFDSGRADRAAKIISKIGGGNDDSGNYGIFFGVSGENRVDSAGALRKIIK